MIAVDTNILVYAHRTAAPDHARALAAIEGLTRSGGPWALPWPVAHEFVRVVTVAPAGEAPTPLSKAFDAVQSLLSAGGCTPLAEPDAHWPRLRDLASAGRATGRLVYDARIAAICLAHGVRELWTADRDFGRFPALRTRNPLVDQPGAGASP